jgi:hypothetical protein
MWFVDSDKYLAAAFGDGDIAAAGRNQQSGDDRLWPDDDCLGGLEGEGQVRRGAQFENRVHGEITSKIGLVNELFASSRILALSLG